MPQGERLIRVMKRYAINPFHELRHVNLYRRQQRLAGHNDDLLPRASNTNPLLGAARARPAIHTSNRPYGVQRRATVQTRQWRRRSARLERHMGKRVPDNALRAFGYLNAGWLFFGSSCPASTRSGPDERTATIPGPQHCFCLKPFKGRKVF